MTWSRQRQVRLAVSPRSYDWYVPLPRAWLPMHMLQKGFKFTPSALQVFNFKTSTSRFVTASWSWLGWEVIGINMPVSLKLNLEASEVIGINMPVSLKLNLEASSSWTCFAGSTAAAAGDCGTAAQTASGKYSPSTGITEWRKGPGWLKPAAALQPSRR